MNLLVGFVLLIELNSFLLPLHAQLVLGRVGFPQEVVNLYLLVAGRIVLVLFKVHIATISLAGHLIVGVLSSSCICHFHGLEVLSGCALGHSVWIETDGWLWFLPGWSSVLLVDAEAVVVLDG